MLKRSEPGGTPAAISVAGVVCATTTHVAASAADTPFDACRAHGRRLRLSAGTTASGRTTSSRPRLQSGVSSIDAALDGGCAVGTILHLYGPAGAGKTTLAMQLAAHVVAKRGGSPHSVLWITEKPFSTERFAEVVAHGGSPEVSAATALCATSIALADDVYALRRLLVDAVHLMSSAAQGAERPGLLVVDSLGPLVRACDLSLEARVQRLKEDTDLIRGACAQYAYAAVVVDDEVDLPLQQGVRACRREVWPCHADALAHLWITTRRRHTASVRQLCVVRTEPPGGSVSAGTAPIPPQNGKPAAPSPPTQTLLEMAGEGLVPVCL